MKKLLSLLVVFIALGAVACGDGDEPERVDQPSTSLSEEAAPETSAAAPAAGAAPAAPAAPQGTPFASAARAFGGASPTREAGAALTEPTSGGTFRRLWADPPTLDPHLTSDTTSAGVVVEIFSGWLVSAPTWS